MAEQHAGTVLHKELSERVIGLFYEVSNDLGYGFMESVYKRSLLVALGDAGISAQSEIPVPVHYRGREVGLFFADIVVAGVMILELKVASEITKQHEAQLYHYLRSTTVEVGFVLAFGERAKFRRIYLTNDRKPNLKRSPSS